MSLHFFLRFRTFEMFPFQTWILVVTALVKSSEGVQYRVHESRLQHQYGEYVCAELGGTLAMPKTSSEQEQMIQAVNQIGNNQYYWIGLKREGLTGEFVWSDYESLTGWVDWRSGEPSTDETGSEEGCVELKVGSLSSSWSMKSCSEFKRFICQLEDDVLFPNNYTVELFLVADQKAFVEFKTEYASHLQHLSDHGKKYMLRLYMYNMIENMKGEFEAINVNLKTAKTLVLDDTLDESGNINRSLDRFKEWLGESDSYQTIRYDVAVLFTGVSHNSVEKGIAASSSICSKDNAAAIVEYYSNMEMMAIHEIGHTLGAEHDDGVMDELPRSRDFTTRSRLQIRNNLELFYKDVYAMLGYDDCVNELSPVGEELNQDMDDDDKTPDSLCANVFGSSSYFCRSPSYYEGDVPSGDAMCQSFQCAVGYHTDCSQLVYTNQNTDGLPCDDGKTCQGWRCLNDPDADDVDESCITGNQKYVTSHDDDSQEMTCEDFLERYGDGACAGDYKIESFDLLCCSSCQEKQHDEDEFGCTYGEGKFPVEGGGEQTCAEYIDNSRLGRGLCNDASFRSFCCQTCAMYLRVDAGDVLGSCAYGEPESLSVGGQEMTCGEFLDAWGDSWCVNPEILLEGRTLGEICCHTCEARRLPEGSECPYEGDNAYLWIGGQSWPCSSIIAIYTQAVCPYYDFIEKVCCSHC